MKEQITDSLQATVCCANVRQKTNKQKGSDCA